MIDFKAASLAILTVLFTLASLGAQESQPSMSAESKAGKTPGLFNMGGGERPSGAKTEITATRESSFDSEKNIAEFTGRVLVRDPQFTLTCDRLKVTLAQDKKGIAVAEAVGNVIIVQEKSDPKSTVQQAIGRAGEVTYKPDSGEVVLRDWPSIQQGINNQVATEQSTVMILRSSGQSRTIGGSKTMITDTAKPQ
ncbi:MAG: LptA/OstA family protein [Spartobacteria bacterium]